MVCRVVYHSKAHHTAPAPGVGEVEVGNHSTQDSTAHTLYNDRLGAVHSRVEVGVDPGILVERSSVVPGVGIGSPLGVGTSHLTTVCSSHPCSRGAEIDNEAMVTLTF